MIQEIDFSKTVILLIVAIPLAYIANQIFLTLETKWLEYKLEKQNKILMVHRNKLLGNIELLVQKGASQSVLQTIFNRDPELGILFRKRLANNPALESLFKKNNERYERSAEYDAKS